MEVNTRYQWPGTPRLGDGLPICKVVRYTLHSPPQKKNKHLEDSLPMSKIVGDSNCKRSATRPRKLHPHGEDHLPLAWWGKTLKRWTNSSQQSFKQTKPVQSSATQTNATVKFAIAAMPTSLQKNLWYWMKSHDNHENNCQSQEKDTVKNRTHTTRERQKRRSAAWRRSKFHWLPSEGRRGLSTWSYQLGQCSPNRN